MSGTIGLGLDPGLKNFGWTLVELTIGGSINVLEMGVICTDKSDKKQKVLGADDNFRRAREQAEAVDLLMKKHVRVVFAESVSFVRNAATMCQVGHSWGVIASLCNVHALPLVQATPQQIKTAVGGFIGLSKGEIQEALDATFGYCLAEKHLGKLKKSAWEHPYDAVGAVVAGVRSEVTRAVLRGSAA